MNEHTATPSDNPDPFDIDDTSITGEVPAVFDSSPYEPGPADEEEDRSRYEEITTTFVDHEPTDGEPTDGDRRRADTIAPVGPPAHPDLPPTPPIAKPAHDLATGELHPNVAPPFGRSVADDRDVREAPIGPETPPVPLARTAGSWDPVAWDPAPKRRRRSGFSLALLGGILGAGLTVGALYTAGVFDPTTQLIETVRTEIANPTQVESTTAAAIAGKVTPAIVTVRLPNGSGSGVIYDADNGYVITNEHVVESAVTVEVVLADGRTYIGQVLGTDSLTDLAVIDIDATGLTKVEIGETETLVVGDPAYAIGNPLALIGTPTVTEGIVSAFDRRVEGATEAETLYGMLQTDAPFTRGSSGGSLVDREGRLIGITTAVAVSDIGAEGLGFATPVEIVQRVIDEIIRSGVSTHGFLGINGGTKFRETSDAGQRPIGVEVVEILTPSAAGAAGMQAGDVITHVDGHAIDTMQELISRLRHYSANEVVNVDYLENGETVSSIEIMLGDRS